MGEGILVSWLWSRYSLLRDTRPAKAEALTLVSLGGEKLLLCAVFKLLCTVYSLQCVVGRVQCTMFFRQSSVQYSVYAVPVVRKVYV